MAKGRATYRYCTFEQIWQYVLADVEICPGCKHSFR